MPPNNPLSLWGNEKTMNLNTLVLTNIQSSPYFKVKLFELKTYHEVIDEIYYKVSHLEPWEKGSRKTAGQTGMCGGVRGVGAGGIVSSAYCLLYKLFTLKMTKKQVIGLINHPDSPYIRGLGFMYIRYSQPPADLWAWFDDYLDDDEEIDVKAGGGHVMTMGEMVRQWLVKLEWYSTLFPRIPVPIQKDLAIKLKDRPMLFPQAPEDQDPQSQHPPEHDQHAAFNEQDRRRGNQESGYRRDDRREDNHRREGNNSKEGSREDGYRNGDNNRDNNRDRVGYRGADSGRDRDNYRGADSGRDRDNYRGADSREFRGRSPANQRQRQSPPFERAALSRRSPPRYANSFERELARERERQQREQGRDKHRSRSHSPRERKEKRSPVRKERRSHSRDRKEKRSLSRDRKEKRSLSRDRKEKRSLSRDRKEKRSLSRDRKEKRSLSRDRKEKRSLSRDRKEKRSGSKERKEKRSGSKERKEKKRSGSRDKDHERHGSSHKHSHKDKRHRDEDKRESKSHKHKHKDREH